MGHDRRLMAVFVAGGLYLVLIACLIATNIAKIGGSAEVQALLLDYA